MSNFIALAIISIIFIILFGFGFSILFWLFIWNYDTVLFDIEEMDFTFLIE